VISGIDFNKVEDLSAEVTKISVIKSRSLTVRSVIYVASHRNTVIVCSSMFRIGLMLSLYVLAVAKASNYFNGEASVATQMSLKVAL